MRIEESNGVHGCGKIVGTDESCLVEKGPDGISPEQLHKLIELVLVLLMAGGSGNNKPDERRGPGEGKGPAGDLGDKVRQGKGNNATEGSTDLLNNHAQKMLDWLEQQNARKSDRHHQDKDHHKKRHRPTRPDEPGTKPSQPTRR